MLRFGVELCMLQHNAGRSFVFEHSSSAISWEDDGLRHLVGMSGVMVSLLDMCRYGMVATDKEGAAPVRKTTRIATNVPEVADALSHRCEGGHRHVHLVSGRPKDAAIYPPGFCSAIVKGFQMYKRRKEGEGKIGALLNFARADLCDPEEEENIGRFVDDIKGTEMDPKLTRAARCDELDEFRRRRVYDVVPRTSMRPGAKIVGVRWVETDKGNAGSPRIRSRLVAQEFATEANPIGGGLRRPRL